MQRRACLLASIWLALAPVAFAAPDATFSDRAWPGGIDIARLIERDFARYDPGYAVHRAALEKRIAALQARLIGIEGDGPSLPCSRQILVEARWALTSTADWAGVARIADRLDRSLDVTDQSFAYLQSAEDGMWGACYERWFHRVDATVDTMNTLLDLGLMPDHRIRLRQAFGTPDELIAFLEELQVSRIAETGTDNRDALGVSLAALSQVMFKPDLRAFVTAQSTGLPIAESYAEAYTQFIGRTQDPNTGYWGAWYESEGALHAAADLSFTFHTISYRRGAVERWPAIIETTFAIRNLPYPYGWLHRGRFNNHNNYDVAVIFRYGWPHMTEAQRSRARQELDAMLDFALGASMNGAGGFIDDPSFYSTPADAYYYGIAFLDVIGFWNRAERFWTDREFDGANAIACRIRTELLKLGTESTASRDALARLRNACTD